jgi:hypothetical protein
MALQGSGGHNTHARRKNIEAKINKGVGQGCDLSPALFNMYMEEAIKEI